MEDRLSQLPDQVLVSILSKLTIRETILTSSLPSQWQYLWMHVTRLRFDLSKFITWETCYYPRLCRKVGLRHINFINNVLDSHEGALLEEFSLSFPFHKHFKRKIDKWLKFVASKKKVEILQIYLSLSKNEHRRYTFPFKFITSPSSNLSPFFGLKVLALNDVDVDNRAVNFFISNCPLLEKLSIHHSLLLKNLKIVGPSCLKLKNLEICHCDKLDFVKIQNVNLVSFKYAGRKINLLLENVASILSTDFNILDSLVCQLISKLTTYFTQLATLSLQFSHMWMDLRFLDYTLPRLNHLKVFVLKLENMIDVYPLDITPIIEVSPYLQKLHIELDWHDITISNRRIIRKNCPHQHLKEVKYSGYVGGIADKILTTCLVENSVALETLIVDPLKYDYQSARSRAHLHLQGKIPKRVKLIIL